MSLVKKIGVLTLGQGINILVNILFLPYMARVLSYEDYGTYGQALMIVAFIGAMLSFGLPKVIFVYLNSRNNEKEVLSSNILAAMLLALIGVILIFFTKNLLSTWFNNVALIPLLSIFSISLLFSLPYQSVNSYLIHLGKVKTSVYIVIISNLIKVGLVVLAIQLYESIYLAVIGILISQIVQLIIGLIVIRKSIVFKFKKHLFYKQIIDGLPLGLTSFVGTAILYTDGMMVSSIEGVEAYAVFRNGAIELPFIATIYASIATIILPEVTKLFSTDKYKEIISLKKKVIMNTMMLTYPIFIFLLFNSTDIIVFYLGEKYIGSAMIFLVFNFTLLIRINDYSDILISANKGKKILFYYVVSLILNVILNYILINLLGSIGAAISTIISLFVLAGLQLVSSLKIIHSSILELVDIKSILKLITASTLLSFIIYFISSNVHNPNYRLFFFFFIYFPIIYYYLYYTNLISKDILKQLLPKKLFK